MAPRSSQRSSQQGGISSTYKKLCGHIKQEKRKKADISCPPDVLNILKEALRSHRNKNTTIESAFAKSVVTEIENGGEDICDRLDASVFCIIVDTILHSDYCRESERGINLLAAALYRESNGSKKARGVEKKNAEIGKECLHTLLTYFIDIHNHPRMRQWVGLLYLQLFQGSDDNRRKFELGPEDTRRAVGQLVIDEANEIIRIICGQLVRAMLDADIPREHLWPVHAESQLYAGFPDSSQKSRGWSQHFQDYMDSIWENIDPPDSIGQLYFAYNTVLIPAHKFGMPSHNVNIVVDTEQMVFMVPAKGDCFDQILEVPFSAIKQMDIRNSDKSQTRGICDATLEISNSKDVFCYLDSAGIVLSRISLSAHPGTIEKMAEELSYICGDLVVFIDNVQLQGKSHNDRDAPSQVSTRTSTALSTVDFNAMESTVSKPLVSNGHAVKKPKVIAETQVEEAAAADLPRSSDGFKQDQADEDELHNASPSSQRFKKPPPKPSTQDNTESQTQLKNAGPKPVKPKAKESIRLSQGQNDNDGPPPRNTDPTRASQIQLKNRRSVNEESEDELGNQNEPALGLEPLTKRGLQASVPSTTEAAVAQERSRRGTANGTVLTSTKVTSAFSHPPRATDFDSEEITSPDGNDASTPKPKVIFGGLEQKAASKFNCEVLPKEATQTRSQKLNKDLSAAAQKKPKRYSLKAKTPLSISTSTVTSAVAKSKIEVSDEMFDILEGEDAQESTNTTNKKSETAKTVAKNSASTSKITGKIATQAAKANAKKRQSAPAVIERTVAATRSQRAAAAIASQRMRNADATDDEAELQIGQEEVAKNPKPKATLNGKKVPSQEVSQAQTEAQTEAHAKSHNAKGTELVVNPDNNDDFHLQQEDARSLGLLNGDFNDHDLYGATPKKRVKKPKGKTVFSQNKGVVDAPTTNGSKSTLEMASKLNDMLGDLDDADVSPVQTSGRKDQPISVQDVARLQKHGPLEEDNAESSPNFSQSIREPEPGTICINDRLPTKTADTESQTQPNDNLILISSCVSSGKALEDVLENNSPTRNLRAGGESRLITQPAGDGKHRHDSDDDPKKRKATTEMPAHSKRRRSNIDEAAKDQNSPRNPVIQDKPTGKKGRISPKSNQRSLSPPSRRSPRLVERELEAWDILNGAIAKKILVDDRLTRKPQVIAFGVKGARNQGASSISKPGPQRDPEKVKGTQPKAVAGRDLKRKREEAQLPSDASPPKKRQSVSPPQDYVIDLIEDDNVQSLTGSPPAPQIPQKASSQTSRVDKNGSPIPLARAGQADHFGKIKKKLLDDVAEQKQPTAEPITEDAAVLPRLRNQFDIFGPKVALASTVKAKTSSPAEVQTRYVAHKKTANGVYEEVSTKEVVVDEKTLADPFIEDASCRSSGFTDRLRAEAPKEKRKLDPKSELLRKMSQKPLDEGKEVSQKATNIDKLPWFPQFSLKEKGKLGGESAMPKRVTQIHFEDLEKTLVNAENQHPSDQSSPGDMTSGNSYESHERDLSRSPPKPRLAPSEVWNMTLRPHYTSLSDTVHRIADEMIIRLAKEEDVMGLLVDQYKENGTKILDELTQKRDVEKAQILENLGQKTKEIVSMYTDAKKFVMKTEADLEENSISVFEKQWRKKQEDIQRQISEGRRVSE